MNPAEIIELTVSPKENFRTAERRAGSSAGVPTIDDKTGSAALLLRTVWERLGYIEGDGPNSTTISALAFMETPVGWEQLPQLLEEQREGGTRPA